MPHYYFNVREGDRLVEDPEGQEFPSLVEARAEALVSARELMAARIMAGKRPNHRKFEIADDSGKLVLVMTFEEAMGG
jgi:hypothetical protein